MMGSLPPNAHAGFANHNTNASAYHRRGSSNTWASLRAKIQEAVQSGKLTQAQANQILMHIAEKHNVSR